MAKAIGVAYHTDWRVLKAVVAALWVTAALVLLAVHYGVPRDEDIVVAKQATIAKPAQLHLANTAR